MAGISIVVPTLNEADNIDPLLRRIFEVELDPGVEREIVIVDDSSTDDTRSRVVSWTRSHPVRLVCRNSKDGLASAVIAGAHEAAHDIVVVMDADLSHPPEKIPELIRPLLDSSHDMVIGSRYVDGGATPEWPVSRRLASRLATVPARLFTDADDPLAGFFATTRTRLQNLRPDVPGFKIGLEVLAVGGDELRVAEVPIVFHDRFEGFSKMNKGVIWDYLKQVWQLSRIATDQLSLPHLATLGVLGMLIDFLFFTVAIKAGYPPVSAHLAALATAGVLLFFGIFQLWRGFSARRRLGWFHCCGALVALVLSASLQGALFLLGQSSFELSRQIAFLPAAIVGVASFIGILVVYVFSGYTQLPRGTRLRMAACGAVLFGILLRLVYLGLPELMEQEAYYWNYSRHLDLSYLDHPPMVATLIWLGTALFGTTEFAVRIGAFLCWFATAFFSYRLTCRLFGRTAALGAVVLLGLLPFYFGVGFMMTPDAPLLACWSALLYFLYCALVEDRGAAWVGVGISLGLGLISKYTIVLLGPAIICFMLVDRTARRWFLRPGPYGAALIALLLFTPVLVWNYQHDWVSFLFQGERRVTGRTFFTTDRLLGHMTAILTPAGILGVLFFFFRGNRFFTAAVETCRRQNGRRWNRNYLFVLLTAVVPFTVFLVFSLTREVKLNWTGPLWLAPLPFLGCTAMSVLGDYRSKLLGLIRWLWPPTVVVLLLAFAGALHYTTLGLPGMTHPHAPFLVGWADFAREVDAAVVRAEAATGNRPVVVGMDPYQIASGLAFYRTKNAADGPVELRRRGVEETLGWHMFGWNSLMYRYWADPHDFKGRDIMAVASSEVRVEFPYYQKHITGMNPIRPFEVKKDGRTVSRMYLRLIYGYRAEVD